MRAKDVRFEYSQCHKVLRRVQSLVHASRQLTRGMTDRILATKSPLPAGSWSNTSGRMPPSKSDSARIALTSSQTAFSSLVHVDNHCRSDWQSDLLLSNDSHNNNGSPHS